MKRRSSCLSDVTSTLKPVKNNQFITRCTVYHDELKSTVYTYDSTKDFIVVTFNCGMI